MVVFDIVYLVLLANVALPLQAVTLHEAQDEALLKRAGQGAAAGEADSRNGMVHLQHVVDQHAASEPELHARAARAFNKFASKLGSSGCNYKGGLSPCPNGHICYYTGQTGVNTSTSVEHRGNIIKTILHLDDEDEADMPDLVTFMGAGTNDAPAMLLDLPEEYRRTADPVMLKMFFVEDTDDVTEECPHDSERVETINDDTLNYSVDVNTNTFSTSVTNRNSNMFMGMTSDFVNQTALGHTNAFMIPANTQIVWVTREEMVQVLQSQELPASAEARLEAQLRKANMARGMDDALTHKGSRRRRRRRRREPSSCSGSSKGAMIGGAAGAAGGIAICALTFIGCFTASPFMVMAGTTSVKNGACDCWGNSDTGKSSCSLR